MSKHKMIFALAGVFGLAGIALTLPSAEAADGRPGQFPGIAEIDFDAGQCAVQYDDPVAGNTFISNPSSEATLKVVENKNKLTVMCRFTDMSGIYESNAENVQITDCSLLNYEGQDFLGGSGHATAAANHDNVDFGTGGNVTVRCSFDL